MKDLEFLKNFNSFFAAPATPIEQVNEDKTPDKGKGPKVTYFNGSATLDEIKQKSPEAYQYILSVTEVLKTADDYKKIPIVKMLFNKKAQLGLSKEEADKLVAAFKADESIKFGTDQFNQVFIDEQPFSKILSENVKLNNMYKELQAAITTWNTNNAAVFNFDNKVSDKVSNPDDSNKALTALKDILTKYAVIVKNVEIDLVGHTSTTGEEEYNKTLSQGRAETVKNLLLAVYPEAKDFNIKASGAGEAEPLHADDKDDAEKQKKNRRVEVKLTADSNQGDLPTEEVTYNVVVYGFVLTEMDEKKTNTNFAPRKKSGFKPLNKKGLIPCPTFMHQKVKKQHHR